MRSLEHSVTSVRASESHSPFFQGCKRKDSHINFKHKIRTFLVRNGLSLDNTTLSFLEKKLFWDSRCLAFCPVLSALHLVIMFAFGPAPLPRAPNSLAVLPAYFIAMSTGLV